MLASPASQLSATVDARLGDGGLAVGAVQTDGNVAAAEAGRDHPGRLESLVDPSQPLTVGFVLVALLVAMGWGALHALTPGHGKTMVAAYLAGSRGTARHAFALGATVTVAHTATVFALGFVTLTLSEFILPEQLYPWLNLVSGLLVLSLGLAAIRQRLRGSGGPGRGPRRGPSSALTSTTIDHGHSHDHGHAHDHGEHGHSHDPPDQLSLAVAARAGRVRRHDPVPERAGAAARRDRARPDGVRRRAGLRLLARPGRRRLRHRPRRALRPAAVRAHPVVGPG